MDDQAIDEKTKKARDPELDAMRRISTAIDGLDARAQQRVVAYFAAKYAAQPESF